jgi:hypothetical protein
VEALTAASSVWPVILTSAGVAALVSSVLGLLGQALERRARRQELLLAKAIELAQSRTDMVLRITEKSGQRTTFQDNAILAEGYYQWLSHLLNNGSLPNDPRIDRGVEAPK